MSGVDGPSASARIAQSILQMQKIVEPQITINNKPGGPYAIAFNYLSQYQGDGSKLVFQTSTPLTAMVTGQFALKYFDFTPVANLISEPILFMVRTESPIANGKDQIGRAHV